MFDKLSFVGGERFWGWFFLSLSVNDLEVTHTLHLSNVDKLEIKFFQILLLTSGDVTIYRLAPEAEGRHKTQQQGGSRREGVDLNR